MNDVTPKFKIWQHVEIHQGSGNYRGSIIGISQGKEEFEYKVFFGQNATYAIESNIVLVDDIPVFNTPEHKFQFGETVHHKNQKYRTIKISHIEWKLNEKKFAYGFQNDLNQYSENELESEGTPYNHGGYIEAQMDAIHNTEPGEKTLFSDLNETHRLTMDNTKLKNQLREMTDLYFDSVKKEVKLIQQCSELQTKIEFLTKREKVV